MSTKDITRFMKDLVTLDNLEGLKELFDEIYDMSGISWDVVYKDVYLHACLKKKPLIVNWLLEVYETMDPITKIALKQLFPYGRYLLNK
uniref:Uncharacterized protein n=1 Tax=viral metagenome TaxID=1070528 RepID=A0A6C0DJP1_9ZZZZ